MKKPSWIHGSMLLALALGTPPELLQGQEQEDCYQVIAQLRRLQADTNSLAAKAEAETARMVAGRCIERVDASKRQGALNAMAADARYLAPLAFDIPENHDEGRLKAGPGSSTLGPMAWIFASPHLGGFTRKAQIAEHRSPGVLAAVVIVENGPMPQYYQALQLQPGKNCIWLNYAPAGNLYHAFVSHPATVNQPCRPTAPPGGTPPTIMTGAPLPVVAAAEPGFRVSDGYPAAARFDEDINGVPVLAFKCLNAFCEVGTTPARRREPGSKLNPVPLGTPVQALVKGWQDEQELAEQVVDAAGVPFWRGSGVRASIVPADNIANHDRAAFSAHADRWFGMAVITIAGPLLPSNKYYGWGLRQGRNYVGMRYASATDTLVVGIFNAKLPDPPSASPSPRKVWKVRERMMHWDVAVPPTARFRFTVGDDGIWIPCGNACCRSDGEIW